MKNEGWERKEEKGNDKQLFDGFDAENDLGLALVVPRLHVRRTHLQRALVGAEARVAALRRRLALAHVQVLPHNLSGCNRCCRVKDKKSNTCWDVRRGKQRSS